MGEYVTHKGGCHCGDVEFEVSAPAALRVQECNCSICRMTGFLHLIVPASRFRLVKGRGRPHDLRLQHGYRAAPVLPALRHQVVLRAALEPGRVQHQRALPRPGHDRATGHRALRWPELGGVGGCAARAFARIGRLPPEAPCAVRRRGSAEVVASVRAAPGRWTRRDSPTHAARRASVPSAVRRVVPWRARPDGAPAAAATYQSTPRQKSPAGKSAKESSFPNSDQLRRCPLRAPFPCLYATPS